MQKKVILLFSSKFCALLYSNLKRMYSVQFLFLFLFVLCFVYVLISERKNKFNVEI